MLSFIEGMRPFLYYSLAVFLLFLQSCHKEENIDIPNTGYQSVNSFQWVLDEVPDPTQLVGFDYIDIDGFEATEEQVAQLQGQGSKVIGYISVGSLENWRPDVDDFPSEVVGKNYNGWAGEKWLDISNLKKIKAPLEARLDMLVAKGFDGIEPDNLDGYESNTGFDITKEETLTFLLWLAEAAHQRGLLIGQKNVPEFTHDLVEIYDYVLTEDAFIQGWEEEVQDYRMKEKPVFMVEYTDEKGDWGQACKRAEQLDYTFLLKQRDLDLWMADCSGS